MDDLRVNGLDSAFYQDRGGGGGVSSPNEGLRSRFDPHAPYPTNYGTDFAVVPNRFTVYSPRNRVPDLRSKPMVACALQ
jgi:hypothetical protein